MNAQVPFNHNQYGSLRALILSFLTKKSNRKIIVCQTYYIEFRFLAERQVDQDRQETRYPFERVHCQTPGEEFCFLTQIIQLLYWR